MDIESFKALVQRLKDYGIEDAGEMAAAIGDVLEPDGEGNVIARDEDGAEIGRVPLAVVKGR